MAITAADIQNVSFSIDRKGYDVDEVDVFLERVADEIQAMTDQIAKLQIEAAAPAPEPAPEPVAGEDAAPIDDAEFAAKVAEYEARIADLEDQLAEKAANDIAIAQALIVAQRSADEVVANARNEASNIIKDADEEADRIIGKAESDRLKIVEAIRELEADRNEVRAGYRDMLSDFMADAQKKLAQIDGDARRANASAQVRNEVASAAYAAPAPVAPAATQGNAPVASPSASGFIDKDLSGFGAADDGFAFDDID